MLAGDALWDRVAGCLHGLLIGDALGSPVEGWTPDQISTEFGQLSDYIELRGRRWRPRGLHCDDGQQALAVLDAICRDPDHPERPFVELLVEMRDAASQRAGRYGLHRAVDREFRQTVRGLQGRFQGRREDPYAHATPSSSSGAAMRIAPAALWYRSNFAIRNARVVQLSAVTHRDLRAIAGALAMTEAIASMLVRRPPPVLTQRFCESLEDAEAKAAAQLERTLDTRFSTVLRELIHERRRVFDLDRLLANIATRARTEAGADHEVEATSAFAPCSVLSALALVDVCGSFEDTLVTAVNLGGKADSIGAMVGALAGARYGLAGIPQRWLDGLRATGTLLERIEQVIHHSSGPCHPDLLKLEKGWDSLYEQRPRRAR